MQFADLKDYPDVDSASINFPCEIYVAYAVCRKECGNNEFISDGETQVCEACGHNMFRTEVRKYVLVEQDSVTPEIMKKSVSGQKVFINDSDHLCDYPDVDPQSVEFPMEIMVTYAVCRKECGASEFIVEGQTDVCEYCGYHMLHTVGRKYILSEDNA